MCAVCTVLRKQKSNEVRQWKLLRIKIEDFDSGILKIEQRKQRECEVKFNKYFYRKVRILQLSLTDLVRTHDSKS